MKKIFIIILTLLFSNLSIASDEMLKEMFAVVGLANKNNKLVDSYQVEVDEFLK